MTEIPGSQGRNTLSLTNSGGETESEPMTAAETLALAQFVKRVGWFEFTSHAVSDDEAHLIKQAVDKLQNVLSRSGYDPR